MPIKNNHGFVLSPEDYNKASDVQGINGNISQEIIDQARSISGSGGVPRVRKIHLILGKNGSGKSHLLSRIYHELGPSCLSVFLPEVEEVEKLPDHFVKYLVEILFKKQTNGNSLIEEYIANIYRLLNFSKLESHSVSDIISYIRSRDESQILNLAKGFARRFSGFPEKLTVAVFGCFTSREHYALGWLRRDGGSYTIFNNYDLGEPISPLEIIKFFAELMSRINIPIIFYLDQFEGVLRENDNSLLLKKITQFMVQILQ